MTRALVSVGDFLFKQGRALLPVALINLRRADHPSYTAEAFVSHAHSPLPAAAATLMPALSQAIRNAA